MSNSPLDRLTSGLGSLIDSTGSAVGGMLANPFGDPTVRLGVTGLSRAGKTVFITSMIHNLLLSQRLPLFGPVAERRLKATIIKPQPNLELPRFAYEQNIDALTNRAPSWPDGTWRLSQLRLSMSYKPKGMFKKMAGDTAVLNVDVVDYPGEWLLDLPLLNLSFADWSATVLEAANHPVRKGMPDDWLKFLGEIDLKSPADERVFAEAAQRYTDYLKACRVEDKMIAYLQPGRFLMPGDMMGSPALTFSPLPRQAGSVTENSFYAECERRFESYKKHVVKPFFKNHFSKIDRQLVLADLLGAAAAGPEAVKELQTALTTVLQSFRPGKNSWLSQITEGKRIEKMIFACTKADHLPRSQHEKLAQLMRDLTFEPANNAQYKGAAIEFMTLASCKATQAAQVKMDGKLYDCISGLIDGDEEPKAFYPGELPGTLAELKQGIESPVAMARFNPPPKLGRDGKGLPHVRMDRALDFLLGDLMA